MRFHNACDFRIFWDNERSYTRYPDLTTQRGLIHGRSYTRYFTVVVVDDLNGGKKSGEVFVSEGNSFSETYVFARFSCRQSCRIFVSGAGTAGHNLTHPPPQWEAPERKCSIFDNPYGSAGGWSGEVFWSCVLRSEKWRCLSSAWKTTIFPVIGSIANGLCFVTQKTEYGLESRSFGGFLGFIVFKWKKLSFECCFLQFKRF